MTLWGERPPRPDAVVDMDGLARALTELRSWAGNPSYAALAAAVGDLRSAHGRTGGRPGKVTVYDCFRSGRTRIDADLLDDLVAALGAPDVDRDVWRRALGRATGTGVEERPHRGSADLPAPRNTLVGRQAPFERLARRGPGTVSTIVGLAGAGKTELALHLARHWTERLGPPCVALWIDLRGYEPDQPPLAPAAVLARLLHGLDVPSHRIEPLDLDQRRDLVWRQVGARPAVIVLDNAASPDQVLPLLPVGARTRLLVTSRRALTTLDDASVVLAELGESAALSLLASRVGGARLDAEPEAARRIAQRCGRLALDLTIAGAAVAAAPDWSLADHATRLEALPHDERTRPALQVSYDQLSESLRHTFRMLALHPGAVLRTVEVAALAGADEGEVAEHLAVLAEEHLLSAVETDSYRLHDVVRAFALHVGVTADPRSRQVAAFHRFADVVVAEVTAHADPREPDLAWLDDRVAELSSFAAVAGAWGADRQLGELAGHLTEYFGISGQPASGEELLRLALANPHPDLERGLRRHLGRTLELRGELYGALEQFELAHTEDDPEAERHLNGMANVLKRMGRHRDAVRYYRQAARLAHERGNGSTHGRALGNLADTMRLLGHHAISQALFDRAEPISRACDDQINLAIVASNRTLLAADVGDLDRAIAMARDEIPAFERIGFSALAISSRGRLARLLLEAGDAEEAADRLTEAWTYAEQADLPEELCELRLVRGRLHAARGDAEQAAQDFRGVIADARQLGVALPEIEALNRLGELAVSAGDVAAARRSHEHAAVLAARAGDRREIERAEAALTSLGRS